MAKGKGPKKPRSEFVPLESGKVPRGGLLANRIPTMPFSWRVDKIDLDGVWGWRNTAAEVLLTEIIPKFHSYESMTWSQIEGPSGSHFVSIEGLCDEAQSRLFHINQNDIDALFSLRITARRRVWGIRDGTVFRVLWWDPDHQICPSIKKHT